MAGADRSPRARAAPWAPEVYLAPHACRTRADGPPGALGGRPARARDGETPPVAQGVPLSRRTGAPLSRPGPPGLWDGHERTQRLRQMSGIGTCAPRGLLRFWTAIRSLRGPTMASPIGGYRHGSFLIPHCRTTGLPTTFSRPSQRRDGRNGPRCGAVSLGRRAGGRYRAVTRIIPRGHFAHRAAIVPGDSAGTPSERSSTPVALGAVNCRSTSSSRSTVTVMPGWQILPKGSRAGTGSAKRMQRPASGLVGRPGPDRRGTVEPARRPRPNRGRCARSRRRSLPASGDTRSEADHQVIVEHLHEVRGRHHAERSTEGSVKGVEAECEECQRAALPKALDWFLAHRNNHQTRPRMLNGEAGVIASRAADLQAGTLGSYCYYAMAELARKGSIPASTMAALRSRARPERIRLLAVPSGTPSRAATST